jgi:Mn2+/Fe2+ NRAMP family transporter
VVTILPVGSITLLYWAAIMNGVLAPPIMFLLFLIGNDRTIMGQHTSSRLSNALVGVATAVMGLVSLVLIVMLFFS